MDVHDFAKLGQKALIKKYGKSWMKELSRKAAEKRSFEAKKRHETSDSKLAIDTSASR
jgi:hypothetical protein